MPKKNLLAFIKSEDAGSTGEKVARAGAILAGVAAIPFMVSGAAAAHTNNVSMSFSSGVSTATHQHHSSHASHSSHALHTSHSSHALHTSHSSHSSHALHTSHGSHASHANCLTLCRKDVCYDNVCAILGDCRTLGEG